MITRSSTALSYVVRLSARRRDHPVHARRLPPWGEDPAGRAVWHRYRRPPERAPPGAAPGAGPLPPKPDPGRLEDPLLGAAAAGAAGAALAPPPLPGAALAPLPLPCAALAPPPVVVWPLLLSASPIPPPPPWPLTALPLSLAAA